VSGFVGVGKRLAAAASPPPRRRLDNAASTTPPRQRRLDNAIERRIRTVPAVRGKSSSKPVQTTRFRVKLL